LPLRLVSLQAQDFDPRPLPPGNHLVRRIHPPVCHKEVHVVSFLPSQTVRSTALGGTRPRLLNKGIWEPEKCLVGGCPSPQCLSLLSNSFTPQRIFPRTGNVPFLPELRAMCVEAHCGREGSGGPQPKSRTQQGTCSSHVAFFDNSGLHSRGTGTNGGVLAPHMTQLWFWRLNLLEHKIWEGSRL